MNSEEIPVTGFYSAKEEFLNALTHGIGAVLAALGMLLLVVLAAIYGDVWQLLGFTVYGASLFFLYLASTLYHTARHPRWRQICRLLDHTAVYLLIAGTYTPFLLVKLRQPIGWALLAVVWLLAIGGILFKLFFIGRYEKWTTLGYVLMGWMCVFAYQQMTAVLPPWALAGMVGGGLLYTVGVLFFVWERIPYNHAIWHLFVLGGSLAHFATILYFVLPWTAVGQN